MDILTAIFGMLSIGFFIFIAVDFFSYGDFNKTAAVLLVVLVLCGILSCAVYKGSKTEDIYIKYDATMIDDDTFKVAKKECIVYTLGHDECKTVDEELIYKKDVYYKFKK